VGKECLEGDQGDQQRWIPQEIWNAHSNLSLDHGIDISGAILEEFIWMARFAFCQRMKARGIKIERLCKMNDGTEERTYQRL
jgi:hypothetical protein